MNGIKSEPILFRFFLLYFIQFYSIFVASNSIWGISSNLLRVRSQERLLSWTGTYVSSSIFTKMRKNKKTAATSSTQTRELKLVMIDKSKNFVPNPHCSIALVEVIPGWVPPLLYYKMVDALRGYSKGMAKLMTANLIAFLSGRGRFLTGIQHVDEQLLQLYREIYEYSVEHGFKLESLL